MRAALGEGDEHDVRRMRRQIVRRFIPWFPVILAVAACSGGSSGGGGPAKDAAWIGNSYVLTIPEANWTKPPNLGGDIGSFVPQFLIGVAQSSGYTMTVTIVTAMNGVQDSCNVTTQVTADGSGYPDAIITVPALPLRITNTVSGVVVDTTVRNFTLTNVLPGTSTKSGDLSAVLDISELYPLFNQIPAASRTPDGVCGVLKSEASTACATCPTTGQPYCLTLEAVQLQAVEGTAPVMSIASSAVPSSCAVDAGSPPMPIVDSGMSSETASSVQPTVDSGAASMDAAPSVDASASDAGSSSHLDATAAKDALGDSQ